MKSNDLSVCSVLFVVFLVLKLTGNISWSWWWVTSPLWLPLAAFVLLFFCVVLCVFVFRTPMWHFRWFRRLK